MALGYMATKFAQRASNVTRRKVLALGSARREGAVEKGSCRDLHAGCPEPVGQGRRQHDELWSGSQAELQRTDWWGRAPGGPAEFGAERPVHDDAVDAWRWVLDDDRASAVNDFDRW